MLTREELQTALIAAGWEKSNKDILYDYYFSGNKVICTKSKLFEYLHISLLYTDCKLIEVPMKDGKTYRAIVCDSLTGIFIRVEL
ncbi:MAG: hypothetical protein WC748_09855 [Legionellales bacterium]|jgi:hypothetical protein